MIISSDDWRGCAASFPQPATGDDITEALDLVGTLHLFNCDGGRARKPLPGIVFRSSANDADICRRVFRWDVTPYEEVFKNGFQAICRDGISEQITYSLDNYVNNGDRTLDSRQPTNHIFIATTPSDQWHPTFQPGAEKMYRYEIFAPGGISVAGTLGDRYVYPEKNEVLFVKGIAPQYIRAVQAFTLSSDHDATSRLTKSTRANTELIVNGNFNPQAQPQRLLKLQNPLFMYHDWASGKDLPLTITIYPDVTAHSNDTIKWYSSDVANCESYIDAAIRTCHDHEAVFFMKNEYVRLEYGSTGTIGIDDDDPTGDTVYAGPEPIAKGFPFLKDTVFEQGIDCAVGSNILGESIIFSGNLCARISYASFTEPNKIIKGPVTIAEMFPFFKSTVFESSVDTGFQIATQLSDYDAYLFKGNQYARINYDNPSLIATGLITQAFESLKGTVFESGIESAFAVQVKDKAYLFKGDSFQPFIYDPDSRDSPWAKDGLQKINSFWTGIGRFLPRKNHGVDCHGYVGHP